VPLQALLLAHEVPGHVPPHVFTVLHVPVQLALDVQEVPPLTPPHVLAKLQVPVLAQAVFTVATVQGVPPDTPPHVLLHPGHGLVQVV